MLSSSCTARPTNCVIPVRSPSQAASNPSTGQSPPRMRWHAVNSNGNTHPARNLPQMARHSQSTSASLSSIISPPANGMLATFEKLQRRLERYDNMDLADFGSVLRVSDHATVLSSAELMSLPGKIHQARVSTSCIIAAIKACGQTAYDGLDFAKTHKK